VKRVRTVVAVDPAVVAGEQLLVGSDLDVVEPDADDCKDSSSKPGLVNGRPIGEGS
jgi:hypothetical protein